jgi:indolepyruvate ferredoxin oxidoreductase alpha subunit
VNAVYNEGRIALIILDNRTTAMTGHQEHPGTGISAQGKETSAIDLEQITRGVGVKDVSVVSAFNIKGLRNAVRSSLDSSGLSVIIVRGACAARSARRSGTRGIDEDRCNQCTICLQVGCPAIQSENGRIHIDSALCAGDACTICQQVCPRQAIAPLSRIRTAKPQ